MKPTAGDPTGSTGGAQVIELGAGSAEISLEEHGPAEVYAFGEAQTSSDEVAEQEVRPEPEPEPAEYDPITAAINAYGLPQRRPGASGAGTGTTAQSMGGGFFERVEPDEDAVAEPAAGDDVVDAVLAEDEHDVAEVGVDASEEEERAPIALGPADPEVTPDDEVAEQADEVEETEETEVAEEVAEQVAEVEEAEESETDGVEEAVAEQVQEPAEEAVGGC